jgi:uncharacterized OB-fold protein
MATAKRVPAVEGLFSDGSDGARLLGSKCLSCGTPYFPKSPVCHNPSCTDSKMEDAEFGPRGTLWSCAVQNYPPPPPAKYDEPYAPYSLGIVDLAEGLRVMGRIHTNAPEDVQVGAEVELVLAPLCHEEDGAELISWMFRPI